MATRTSAFRFKDPARDLRAIGETLGVTTLPEGSVRTAGTQLRAALVIGPTGLGLASDGTLYVADTLSNRVAAIPNALLRGDSGGIGGRRDSKRSTGCRNCANGDILTVNAGDGNIVEVSPAGAQVAVKAIDTSGAAPARSSDSRSRAMARASTSWTMGTIPWIFSTEPLTEAAEIWRQGWDYEQWKRFGSHTGQPGCRDGAQNTE